MINARYYGYTNSDILLHPNVFRMLSLIEAKRKHGIIPHTFSLVGRVKNINTTIESTSLTSLSRVMTIMDKGKTEKYRSKNAMVLH